MTGSTYIAISLALVGGGCRLHFDEASIADATLGPPSCVSLPATCGPTGAGTCCEKTTIPGGTFFRSYDAAADAAYPDMTNPATVASFRLDRYEVTVGRFRAFLDAGYGTQPTAPAANAAENPHVPGSGWQSAWSAQLPADRATLEADAICSNFPTWTTSPGANETLPMNCVSWYVAAAFCAWDGGYLPTEAEWNFAAAGGDEQRAYPWSNPPADVTIACTQADFSGCGAGESTVGLLAGTSRWGNDDLAGNVWEWTLDATGTYPNPCDECASLTGTTRVVRGGGFASTLDSLRVANRFQYFAIAHLDNVGIRCAYAAP